MAPAAQLFQYYTSKADSTLRSSRAVPHPSTNRALRRLTSEVRGDPVHSTRYGRQRDIWTAGSKPENNNVSFIGSLGVRAAEKLHAGLQPDHIPWEVSQLPVVLLEHAGWSVIAQHDGMQGEMACKPWGWAVMPCPPRRGPFGGMPEWLLRSAGVAGRGSTIHRVCAGTRTFVPSACMRVPG